MSSICATVPPVEGGTTVFTSGGAGAGTGTDADAGAGAGADGGGGSVVTGAGVAPAARTRTGSNISTANRLFRSIEITLQGISQLTVTLSEGDLL
ncbi:hypothetical protein AAQ05_004485 [Salmonella enterica subsp. diarizonae]|nr:hypothetical protein [Salmonella enterica subsp. diarizonae]